MKNVLLARRDEELVLTPLAFKNGVFTELDVVRRNLKIFMIKNCRDNNLILVRLSDRKTPIRLHIDFLDRK